MKFVDKYYEKIYKQTQKITKKLFKKNIPDCMATKYKLKKKIEGITRKSINDVTPEDIYKNKLGYDHAKYKTLSKIIEIVENACTFKIFTIEELENECK